MTSVWEFLETNNIVLYSFNDLRCDNFMQFLKGIVSKIFN